MEWRSKGGNVLKSLWQVWLLWSRRILTMGRWHVRQVPMLLKKKTVRDAFGKVWTCDHRGWIVLLKAYWTHERKCGAGWWLDNLRKIENNKEWILELDSPYRFSYIMTLEVQQQWMRRKRKERLYLETR